ncbi:MAG: alpha/beta hydrolase [Hyphomicrobiaceae bacterium]|nr:alpha/beta hydrolase [Hyphomicrobiaceae bacterium]
MTLAAPLGPELLPPGVGSRFIDGVNGLRMHVLEAGDPGKPLLLLLHGFPELAYSWRHVLRPLASLGFHVVAPDQRGYGRTTGWSPAYDQDLRPFSLLHLAADAVALVYALGARTVAGVVGHDFGSPVAAWAALARPDLFRSVVLMSAPFAGAPRAALGAGAAATGTPAGLHAARDAVADGLAALARPRKHYQWYYATRAANADMLEAPQGLHAFLRAYFHFKSADFAGNAPFRLEDASPEQLALMPAYYIMDLAHTMPQAVTPFMPTREAVACCTWLTEADLAVYAGEFARTGLQGGLNWYRTRFDPAIAADFSLYANRTIDVPSLFIAGRSDWGVYQVPGAFEDMQARATTRMLGCHLVDGAGHWVMQERPVEVVALIEAFLARIADGSAQGR